MGTCKSDWTQCNAICKKGARGQSTVGVAIRSRTMYLAIILIYSLFTFSLSFVNTIMMLTSRNMLIAANAFIIYNLFLCGFESGVRAANLGEECDPRPSYRYKTLILLTYP
jgi:hypothetical protein